MGHEREMEQLTETIDIYTENPPMRYQLTSFTELIRQGGTPDEKSHAEDIKQEFNITPEDVSHIPAFWIAENLKRMK